MAFLMCLKVHWLLVGEKKVSKLSVSYYPLLGDGGRVLKSERSWTFDKWTSNTNTMAEGSGYRA